MENSFCSVVTGCQGMLASGDASGVQLSESLLGLLPVVQDSLPSLETTVLVAPPPDHSPWTAPQADQSMERTAKQGTSWKMYEPHRCTGFVKWGIESAKLAERGRSSRSGRVMGPTLTIDLAEIAPLLYCEECHSMPMTSLTVHNCDIGHVVCGHCFGNGHRMCYICEVALDGRDEVLETVLQRLRQACPQLFLHENPPKVSSDLGQKQKVSSNTMHHSSHRPVTCPHLTCHRMFASNGFLTHFKYEHPSVPVLQMSLNYRHTFRVTSQSLLDTSSRAISVIEINLDTNNFGPMYNAEETSSAECMFRVRRDVVVCVLLISPIQVGGVTFVAAWCSCLFRDLPPVNYSLGATSPSRRIYYAGCMTSLHHSQKSPLTTKDTRCVVLTPRRSAQNYFWYLELKFEMTEG